MTLVVLTCASALIPVQIAIVGKLIVDRVLSAAGTQASEAIVWPVMTLVAVEGILVAGQGLIERCSGIVRQIVTARLLVFVNVLVLEKATRLTLAQFEDPSVHDMLIRARTDAASRPISLLQNNLQLLRQACAAVGYVAIVARSGWLIVGALLVATVPAFFVEARFSEANFKLKNSRSATARLLGYLQFLATDDRHCKEVKIYRLAGLLVDRYRELAERFHHEDLSLAVRRTKWTYVLSLVSTGTFYACFADVASRAARGAISIGDMTLYVVAFRQGQQALQGLLGSVGVMYDDNLYVSNLFEFLELAEGERAPAIVVAGTHSRTGLRLVNVGFRYPNADRWTLRHIDLMIPAGQHLALVGANGAGKSTLVKLVSGLYEPSEGAIYLDDRKLSDWDREALRRRIGVLFQDFNRYQLTLRENVGFGCVERSADDNRLVRAVDRASATDVVTSLPNGLATQLGRWFDGGVELSGGQWQKTALARAFMDEDADILILDEPAASLDPTAERALFERFHRLAADRTAIVISHRFPTVRIADRIVVLDSGDILEDGTHAELIAQGGRYAELFAIQAEGYR